MGLTLVVWREELSFPRDNVVVLLNVPRERCLSLPPYHQMARVVIVWPVCYRPRVGPRHFCLARKKGMMCDANTILWTFLLIYIVFVFIFYSRFLFSVRYSYQCHSCDHISPEPVMCLVIECLCLNWYLAKEVIVGPSPYCKWDNELHVCLWESASGKRGKQGYTGKSYSWSCF
jgi:hypothetical protein